MEPTVTDSGFSWKVTFRRILAFIGIDIGLSILLIWSGLLNLLEANAELISKIVDLLLLFTIFHLYREEIWKAINPKNFRFVWLLLLVPFTVVFKVFGIIIIEILFGEQLVNTSVEQQYGFIGKIDPHNLLLFALFFLSVAIITPIYEEIFYRGIIFNYLKQKMRFFPALLLSSALFGIAHVSPPIAVNAFLIGMFNGAIYEKTKNIKYAIVAHAVYNGLPFLFLLADALKR